MLAGQRRDHASREVFREVIMKEDKVLKASSRAEGRARVLREVGLIAERASALTLLKREIAGQTDLAFDGVRDVGVFCPLEHLRRLPRAQLDPVPPRTRVRIRSTRISCLSSSAASV